MTLDSAAPAAGGGKKHSARGKRITIDSVLYVLRMAEDPEGATLNKLARKRYENYRDASTVINKLVQCGMIIERITRDERQIRGFHLQ
jgi:predicted transcriptional regulator